MAWIVDNTTTPGSPGFQLLAKTIPGTGWNVLTKPAPPYEPSLDFSNARNSGYLVLPFVDIIDYKLAFDFSHNSSYLTLITGDPK